MSSGSFLFPPIWLLLLLYHTLWCLGRLNQWFPKIPLNPDELEYRINNSPEQNIKSYDYFISHSSKDSRLVQKLIIHLNSQGKMFIVIG